MTPENLHTFLALDLASGGFGFVVVTRNAELVEWATRGVRGNVESRLFEKLWVLVDFYRPDSVILEDPDDPDARRGPRIVQSLREITTRCRSRRIPVRLVRRSDVRKAFSALPSLTKHAIATYLVGRYPVLAPRLPRKRRPWQSEELRIRIFGALAFALASNSVAGNWIQ